MHRNKREGGKKMKNEVVYFLAKMAVALSVVDALIPRAEHYLKSKNHHPHDEKERSEEDQRHYTKRLTSELPEKMHHQQLHHYNYPPPYQHQRYHSLVSSELRLDQEHLASPKS